MVARRRRGSAAVVLALVIAAGTVVGTAGTADAVTVGVRGIFNGSRYVWSPTVKPINRGVIVRWRSVEGSHTEFEFTGHPTGATSGTLPVGTSVARTFNRRGTLSGTFAPSTAAW